MIRPGKSFEELEFIGQKTSPRGKDQWGRSALAHVRFATCLCWCVQCFPCDSYLLPNGILYYTIDAAFSQAERAIIASSFAHIEGNTCIRSLKKKQIKSTNQTKMTDDGLICFVQQSLSI